MSRDDASAAVEAVAGFHVVDTDRSLILEAAELATRAQLSILDAAIVGAARARRLPAAPDDDLGNGAPDTILSSAAGPAENAFTTPTTGGFLLLVD